MEEARTPATSASWNPSSTSPSFPAVSTDNVVGSSDGERPFIVSTYNTGGTTSLEVLKLMMEKWISPRPLVIGLTEFRLPHNVSQWYANRVIRCTSAGEYHLVVSASGSKGGVAFLVSTQLFPSSPPEVKVVMPGRILEFQSKMSHEPKSPSVKFVVFYGSNLAEERQVFEEKLAPYLSDFTVLMGDFNAITRLQDTNAVSAKAMMWQWLVEAEASCKLVDITRLACNGSPPPTRVRSYGSTRSYLDRIYVSHLVLPWVKGLNFLSFRFKKSNGKDLSDHNPVCASINVWGSDVNDKIGSCKGWTNKQTKLFRARVRKVSVCDPSEPGYGTPDRFQALSKHLLRAMESVNKEKQVRSQTQGSPKWEEFVKKMMSLSRRNPRLFFRRAKALHLVATPPSENPIPVSKLVSLLQYQTPFDLKVLDDFPRMTTHLPKSPPTNEDIRRAAKVPRGKSAGPDGIPPYLYFLLTGGMWEEFCTMVRSCLVQPEVWVQAGAFDATLVGIFKKGDWSECHSWRPISMCNALYRIVVRCLMPSMTECLEGWVSNSQFGARKGRGCSQATFRLQDMMRWVGANFEEGYALHLDLENAFSSIPLPLVIRMLPIIGLPESVCHFVAVALVNTRVTDRKARQWWQPTSGVKQGCPLSPLLYACFHEMLLQLMRRVLAGVLVGEVSYIDDTSAVFTSEEDVRLAVAVVFEQMSRLGVRLNPGKTVIQPIFHTKLIQVPIPDIVAPATGWWVPVWVGGQLLFEERSEPYYPENRVVNSAPFVWHLGHPLPYDLDAVSSYRAVINKIQPLVNHFNNQPLHAHARVTLINIVLIPKIVYMLECTPPVRGLLQIIADGLIDFLKSVCGLSSSLVDKTLYSKRPIGLGIRYIPVCVPVRVLDAVDKYVRVVHPGNPPKYNDAPFAHICFEAAAQCLGASTRDVRIPVQTVLSQFATTMEVDDLGNEVCLPNRWGFKVFTGHLPQWEAKEIYTDGSFYEEAKQCGSAVIFSDGTYLQFRPPGQQGIYKAEMAALLMAVEYAPPRSVIRIDNKGVISAVKGCRERVILRRWVERIRQVVTSKELVIKHIKAHVGEVGNDLADSKAKAAVSLPLPKPVFPHEPWLLSREGEIVDSPHKVWAKVQVPSHTPESIHPRSWQPWKKGMCKWAKWLFGTVDAIGFDHHKSFWYRSSVKSCPVCLEAHNLSVHGCVSFCSEERPLVRKWVESWHPHEALVRQWRREASSRERFLLGKLVLPQSLVLLFINKVGWKETKRVIHKFQSVVVDRLDEELKSGWQGRFKRVRPNVFIEDDWVHEHTVEPRHAKTMGG